MNTQDKEKGSVILEASIILPIFIFAVLFIYGLFNVAIADNQMTHALIQASKSLSLDSYLSDKTTSLKNDAEIWNNFEDVFYDLVRDGSDVHFSSEKKWYNDEEYGVTVGAGEYKGQSSLYWGRTALSNRFKGFLAGGEKQDVDDKLNALGVTNLRFDAYGNGDEVTLVINYDIQLMFDFFNGGKLPMKHAITIQMWRDK